jgi:hypothetical protein
MQRNSLSCNKLAHHSILGTAAHCLETQYPHNLPPSCTHHLSGRQAPLVETIGRTHTQSLTAKQTNLRHAQWKT